MFRIPYLYSKKVCELRSKKIVLDGVDKNTPAGILVFKQTGGKSLTEFTSRLCENSPKNPNVLVSCGGV